MSTIKFLVETCGDYGLLDTQTRQDFPATRPTVAEDSQFIQRQIGFKQLKILGPVTEDATDEAFLNTIRECTDEKTGEVDMEMAVESFLSEFSEPDAKVTKKSSGSNRKPRGGKNSKSKDDGDNGAADDADDSKDTNTAAGGSNDADVDADADAGGDGSADTSKEDGSSEPKKD